MPRILIVIALAAILSACGGGGDSYTTVNEAPATVIVETKPLPERSDTSPEPVDPEPIDTTPPVPLPKPEEHPGKGKGHDKHGEKHGHD